MTCGKFEKDPGEQTKPFAEDQANTIIKDPIEGVETSQEFKHPVGRAEAPIEDGFAARWQEHAYDTAYTDVAPRAWRDNACIELARFIAPPGTQGVVSILETAALLIPSQGPPTSDACDCPWWYDYLNAFATSSSLSFHLRLDTWRRAGIGPGPATLVNSNELPGTPHPSLGTWNDARYDFGRHNLHVSLFVPEGTYLRLFAEFGFNPRDLIDRMWGRLGGITQHYRGNVEAIEASRAWPG